MSERRRFDPGVPGGVETAYLSLPFESTSCEDWYGFGDGRCPNRYKETGNLETDIASLKKWVGLYGGHGRTHWKVINQDLLEKKQAELSIIRKRITERKAEELKLELLVQEKLNEMIKKQVRLAELQMPTQISTINPQVITQNTGRVTPIAQSTNNPQIATINNPKSIPVISDKPLSSSILPMAIGVLILA